jgi:hypothetical protein
MQLLFNSAPLQKGIDKIKKPIPMREPFLIISLGINIYLMFKSLELTRMLYDNAIIDLPTKRSFTLLSIVIPIWGYITTYRKYKRSLTRS